MLFTLAWRNLWRNKNRTFITMASISSAVLLSVTLVSLQRGIFDNLIRNVVSFYTGYIQVHGKGYWNDQTLENCLPLTDGLLDSVLATPGVAGVTPRLEAFSLASFGETTKGCMVVGIDPEAENKITRLKDKLISGVYPGKGDSGLMVAEGMARTMGLHAGDTLVLLGQSMYGSTAAGKFVITGLLRFGAPDLNERLVYMDIGAARLMYDTGDGVTSVIIRPADETGFRQLAATLQSSFSGSADVMTWEEKNAGHRTTHRDRYCQHVYYLGCFVPVDFIRYILYPADDACRTPERIRDAGRAGHETHAAGPSCRDGIRFGSIFGCSGRSCHQFSGGLVSGKTPDQSVGGTPGNL